MSGALFFTADTHIGHRMVAQLRGFDSVEEHDRHLVGRWNSIVGPDDQVWHLGDVSLKPFTAVADTLAELNGTLHLVAGNHDAVWPGHREAHREQPRWLARFASVQAFARRRIGGQEVLLSHFPYAGSGDHTELERFSQYRLHDEGRWLLHGHVHAAWRQRGRQVNVGLDVWEMAPVPMHVLEALIVKGDAGGH